MSISSYTEDSAYDLSSQAASASVQDGKLTELAASGDRSVSMDELG